MTQSEELNKLHELWKSGAISGEEFEQGKANLLGGGPQQGMLSSKSERQWAMFLHLSQYAGLAAPGAGMILPLILWQLKKDDVPGLDAHGRMITNWSITSLIYFVVSLILCFVAIGFAGLFVLGIMCLIFPIIGAIKANDGETWHYPTTISFF